MLKLNIKKYFQSQIQPNNESGTHVAPASKLQHSSLLILECDILIRIVTDTEELRNECRGSGEANLTFQK